MNAEAAVLGACLCAPECYWKVADLLTPDDFANGTYSRLFAFIAAACIAATAFGPLAMRRRGIYFAMITIASGQLL